VVDLFATMTSIAGVEGVEGVDSVNLVPLLTSTSVGLERSVIYTESFGLSHTADEPTNIGTAALRNRRFKMTSRVTYPVDPCVDSFEYSDPSFYDLGHDPAESQDLLAHPMTDRMQENYDILHTNMMDLHQSWLNEGCEG
jgi:arylsulfatase A-like enzyme